jgi:hypothetical protein
MTHRVGLAAREVERGAVHAPDLDELIDSQLVGTGWRQSELGAV